VLWRWIRARRAGRVLAPAALAVVLVIGVLDQTSKSLVPPYADAATQWRNDARFVAGAEQALPRGAMILQLPFHPFPEALPEGTMVDYDLFKGYVHSRHLRWSYGAMKGRPEDWTAAAATAPVSQVVPEAVAAGFAAVYVDRFGYADGGAAVEGQIREALGVSAPLTTSEDGRLVLYDARPLAQRLRGELTAAQRATLARALSHPLGVTFAGIDAVETHPTGSWQWMSANATVTIDNSGSAPRSSAFVTRAAAPQGATLNVALPGQAPRAIRFTSRRRSLRLRFSAPPGKSTIVLHVDAPNQGGTPADPRDLRLQMFTLQVGDDAVPPAP
jgi:hypothetical protein